VPVATDRGQSENHVLVGGESRNCDEQFGREAIDKWDIHRWWFLNRRMPG
jgi:hypothetical protein